MVVAGQVDAPGTLRDQWPRAATPDHRDDAAVGDDDDRLVDHPAGQDVDHAVGGDDDRFGLSESWRERERCGDEQAFQQAHWESPR